MTACNQWPTRYCSVAKSCLIVCDPVDCRLPGSSVKGISQARILEWVAISFPKASSQLRDQICVSCVSRLILYHWATWEASLGVHSAVLQSNNVCCCIQKVFLKGLPAFFRQFTYSNSRHGVLVYRPEKCEEESMWKSFFNWKRIQGNN